MFAFSDRTLSTPSSRTPSSGRLATHGSKATLHGSLPSQASTIRFPISSPLPWIDEATVEVRPSICGSSVVRSGPIGLNTATTLTPSAMASSMTGSTTFASAAWMRNPSYWPDARASWTWLS